MKNIRKKIERLAIKSHSSGLSDGHESERYNSAKYKYHPVVCAAISMFEQGLEDYGMAILKTLRDELHREFDIGVF